MRVKYETQRTRRNHEAARRIIENAFVTLGEFLVAFVFQISKNLSIREPMIFVKFVLRVIFTAAVFIVMLRPTVTPAQATIRVTRDAVKLNLPENITFSLSAQSSRAITKANLVYDTQRRTCQDSVAVRPMQFTPALAVDLDWTLDFVQAEALLPGQQLVWHWEIEDAEGNQLITDQQNLVIQDQRHTWQSTTAGSVTVQWYLGDRSFGNRLAVIGANGLKDLQFSTGAQFQDAIRLVIYPDAEALREVLVQSATWTGGVAITGQDLILLAINSAQLDWAQSSIPHEISHLVVSDLTFNCFGVLTPLWLLEGLAQHVAEPLSSEAKGQVLDAIRDNRLPTLKILEGEFSAYGDQAILDYAHSQLVVEFLIRKFGPAKMSALLTALQSGTMIDEALQAVYDLDTAGLEAAWRVSLGFPAPTPQSPGQSGATATTVATLALWTPFVRPSATPHLTLPSAVTPTFMATETSTAPPTATTSMTISPSTESVSLTPSATSDSQSGSGKVCAASIPLLLFSAWVFYRRKHSFGRYHE